MANPWNFILTLIRKRWFQITSLSIIALIVVVGLYIRHQMNQLPEWWAPADPTNTNTIRQGESTENLLVTEMNRIQGRPHGAEWAIELTEADINAWLATRLPNWAANQFPGSFLATGINDAHVRLENQTIRFGTLVDFNPPASPGSENSHTGQSVSITLEPRLDDQGQLQLDLTAATLGQLPIPAKTIVGRALRKLKIPNQDLQNLINGNPSKVIISRGKARRMILTYLQIKQGSILLGWRTEVGNPTNPNSGDG